MSEEDYHKILKNKKTKVMFSAGVLPSIIFFILIFLMISFGDNVISSYVGILHHSHLVLVLRHSLHGV